MPASANPWQRHHPARVEINHRIAMQEHRITRERRDGEISGYEAHRLREHVRHVRMEERADARFDHDAGHLRPGQARHLNRELNGNSRAIGG